MKKPGKGGGIFLETGTSMANEGKRTAQDAKSVDWDLYLVDGEGTVHGMEMQTADAGQLPKRTRSYQAMMELQRRMGHRFDESNEKNSNQENNN